MCSTIGSTCSAAVVTPTALHARSTCGAPVVAPTAFHAKSTCGAPLVAHASLYARSTTVSNILWWISYSLYSYASSCALRRAFSAFPTLRGKRSMSFANGGTSDKLYWCGDADDGSAGVHVPGKDNYGSPDGSFPRIATSTSQLQGSRIRFAPSASATDSEPR